MEYLIKTKSIGEMSDEQFFQFYQENNTIKFERNAEGEIIITTPTGSETGWYNLGIATELGIWNKEKKLGIAFDSNTGFTLPNHAVRSADVAYIKKERWLTLAKEDRKNSHIWLRT